MRRREAIGLIGGGLVSGLLASCARGGGADTLFVGDQRGGSRVVLTASGGLEGLPYRIEWSQFPNAAPLLEALNAGAIDTGIGGDAAFIFAIGSGATIKAIGAQKSNGLGPVIVVKQDSPIRTLGGLAGARIATPRGSISHNHVLAVLEAYGQPYDAVRFAFLSPSDGKAALESGAVDAWAIWDPHAAIAEQGGHARLLTGKDNLVPGYSLVFGRDGAIADKRTLLADYRRRLYTGWTWAADHREAYAELMHRDTGVALDIMRITVTRADRRPVPVTPELIAEEQRTADRYYRAGLIAKPIDVRRGFDTSFS